MRKSVTIAACLAAMAATPVGMTAARSAEKAPLASPAVAGSWTGTWGPYVAPKPDEKGSNGEAKTTPTYPILQKQLDCKVVALPGGEWEATFEGECGRPYKYTIKMTGHQAGNSVLFKGTTDLGAKDGGVYDWIGRATDKEFVGFYTSATHTGTFTLARPKQ